MVQIFPDTIIIFNCHLNPFSSAFFCPSITYSGIIEYLSVVPDTLLDMLLNLNTRYIQSITALRPHAAQHIFSALLSISA